MNLGSGDGVGRAKGGPSSPGFPALRPQHRPSQPPWRGAVGAAFHWHVLPRAEDDGLLMNWPLLSGDMAAIAETAERLRAAR